MGESYRSQGSYAEAIKWFKKGIEVDPANVANYHGMGESYRSQGSYAEAIKWFKKGIKTDPAEGSNYYGMGESYRGKGDYQEAIKWFKKGIEIDPSNVSNYHSMCRLRASIKPEEYVEIIDFLRDLARSNPFILDYIEMLKRQDVDREIDNWIKSGIGNIVKICQGEGIKIILQNYPSGDVVNQVIKEVAKEYTLAFVDNEQAFNELGRREDYFLPDGHCNEKGYTIMANNIYNKMMELNILDLSGRD